MMLFLGHHPTKIAKIYYIYLDVSRSGSVIKHLFVDVFDQIDESESEY